MLDNHINYQSILALDFDGVLCDGLAEYFHTSCLVHQQIWGINPDDPEVKERFYRFRPLIEFGWEMPVILRAITTKQIDDHIWQNWANIRDSIMEEEGISTKEVTAQLDQLRDRQIREELTNWLELHQFYPGIISTLQELQNVYLVIITTKDGRFTSQLLANAGIHLDPSQIMGKEVHRSKSESLQILMEKSLPITFIEDKLSTLLKVTQVPSLDTINLYLADWGYNRQEERDIAHNHPRIELLTLNQFTLIGNNL
jgi:phosphoglycolate phosphatase-like HAD superfamily hydrolase